MSRIIKIKCNGKAQDVNEIDLDQLTAQGITIAIKGTHVLALRDGGPQRFVQKCRFCAEGRIVITSEMLAALMKE